jgi:hypothetical protein
MPTRDATLLPPPPVVDPLEDRSSVRSLDAVGVENVLDAMRQVKARRESRPSHPSFPHVELGAHDVDELDANGEVRRRHRVPADSDAFLKAR